MKLNKILLPIVGLGLCITLVGCGSENPDVPQTSDDQVVLTSKDIKLTAIDDYSPIKARSMKTYFKENGSVPYVGVKTFINALNGFYRSSAYKSSLKDGVLSLENITHDKRQLEMIIDANEDVITTNSSNFFSTLNISDAGLENPHYRFANKNDIETLKNPIEIDLKKYDFDAIAYGNDVLLPLSVLTTIGLFNDLAHLFYNGEEYFLYADYLRDEDVYFKTRNSSTHSSFIPQDLVDDRNNQLYFLLDYYYGLKQVKGIDDFKQYIASKELINEFLNTREPTDVNEALVQLLITDFDDPHTSTGFKNYYQKVDNAKDLTIQYGPRDVGERIYGMLEKQQDLEERYEKAFNDKQYVRFEGNTAFIKFDTFQSAPYSIIFNKDGSVSPQAKDYDTFYLIRYCFDEILKRDNVENVVIDLSLNTGGDVTQIFSNVGIFTNQVLKRAQYDSLTNESWAHEIYCDSDDDGDFDDNDGYEQFNYYILTSNVTFSAGNTFTSILKDGGVVTTIGEKSGGGSCTVGPASLIDGTTLTMSSNNISVGYDYLNGNNKTYSIEYGVDVDYEIGYDKFYDLAYLNNQINNVWNKN